MIDYALIKKLIKEHNAHFLPVFGVNDEGICLCSKGVACKRSGKHPVKEYAKATNNFDLIHWWMEDEFLGFNLGLVPGRSGLAVLDIDDKPEARGFDSLKKLEEECGPRPETLTLRTGGGGLQEIYSTEDGIAVPHGQAFRPGIDTRVAANSLAVMPGSRHSSGNYYELIKDVAIAPFPEAWARAFKEKQTGVSSRNLAAIPQGLTGQVVQDGEGRDAYLWRVLCKLQRDGLLTDETALAANESFLEPPKSAEAVLEKVRRIQRQYPIENHDYITPIVVDFNPLEDREAIPFVQQVHVDGRRRQVVSRHYVAEDVALYALEQYNATADYKNEGIRLNRLDGGLALYSPEEVYDRIVAAIDRVGVDGFSRWSLMKPAIVEWLRKERLKVVHDLQVRTTYRPESETLGESHLKEFLMACTGEVKDLDLVTLKHWMRNVKRNLANLSVNYHLMLVFCGAQGSGKSEALEKLWAPIEQLVGRINKASILEDERQAGRFEKYYIIFLDEMSGLSRSDMGIVKNTITAPSFQHRVLGTHSIKHVKNNASFIGAANDPLIDLANDPTGMRRFWQIDCLKVLDWETLEGLDYEAMWQSIDEMAPQSDIINHWKEIREIQDTTLRRKDPIEEFLETQVMFDPNAKMMPSEALDLYAEFLRKTNPMAQLTTGKFYRKLKAHCEYAGWNRKTVNGQDFYPLRRAGLVLIPGKGI